MPPHRRKIFVSYSHKDIEIAETVFTHLSNLDDVDVWVDQKEIRAGDLWQQEIETALTEAHLALLLISPNFLSSLFIKDQELPRLRVRREQTGLRMIPVLLKPCAWQSIEWLSATEVRPRGDHALSELMDKSSSQVDRALGDLMNEIAGILKSERPGSDKLDTDGGGLVDNQASITLVRDTVLRGMGKAASDAAGRVIERLARVTTLSREGLLNATRFCIEYHLLNSEELVSPLLLDFSSSGTDENEEVQQLVKELKRRSRASDFSSDPVDVTSQFFGRARDREEEWKHYFEVLAGLGMEGCTRQSVASLCQVRVRLGFLSPQFLVAGLLSHFDDDWRPVLNAYQRAIPDPKHRSGAFESVQASQWNCWLVWGPSIPVCRCSQWKGLFAFQYGYGDENNSLPVIELEGDEAQLPKTLGPIAAHLAEENRHARPVQLTGRLRWGPWFLRQSEPNEPTEREIDLDNLDRSGREEEVMVVGKYGAAPAQAAFYKETGIAHRDCRDGLVLQLATVDLIPKAEHVYFSAYFWLMFLVAVPAKDPSIGPGLLRGKAYPTWPETEDERRRVVEARLWEDLLPVFVHANIADPSALTVQKELLVQNGLALLKQVWTRRAEMFHPDDVNAGIQFHLVCGSDYTGCGCDVRYPPRESLVQLLWARLADEADKAFAAAVVPPAPDETDASRPWGLAGYFSACHLPELISDYYEHVHRGSRAQGRTGR